MNDIQKERILETTVRILEEWAMTIVDPAPALKAAELCAAPLVVKVAYRGDKSGLLEVCCGDNLARHITENLIGESADSNAAYDGVRELANVLCGNLLTEIYDTNEVYELSPPSLSFSYPENIETFVALQADGLALGVRITEE